MVHCKTGTNQPEACHRRAGTDGRLSRLRCAKPGYVLTAQGQADKARQALEQLQTLNIGGRLDSAIAGQRAKPFIQTDHAK